MVDRRWKERDLKPEDYLSAFIVVVEQEPAVEYISRVVWVMQL